MMTTSSQRQVTIRDIARRSNVAPGTVSMVLNGRGRLSSETRVRVEAVIAELGYRPRAAGRPRSEPAVPAQSIAVVYAQRVARRGVLSRLSQEWISGIRDVAMANHCHLSLIGGLKDASQDEMFRHSIEAGHFGGVILIGITADDGQNYLTRSLSRGLPTVVMNRTPVHAEFSYVAMDNFGSGQQVVDYLTKLGHEKIALVHLRVPERYATDRVAGTNAALKSIGLEPVCVEHIEVEPSPEELERVCHAVLKCGATAVYLTAGDLPATLAIDQWERMGIRIPHDLTVIGWDNIGHRSGSGLVPTSVGYDKRLMGREAAQMILELGSRKSEARSRGLIVRTSVVTHDTSGPRAPSDVLKQ